MISFDSVSQLGKRGRRTLALGQTTDFQCLFLTLTGYVLEQEGENNGSLVDLFFICRPQEVQTVDRFKEQSFNQQKSTLENPMGNKKKYNVHSVILIRVVW